MNTQNRVRINKGRVLPVSLIGIGTDLEFTLSDDFKPLDAGRYKLRRRKKPTRKPKHFIFQEEPTRNYISSLLPVRSNFYKCDYQKQDFYIRWLEGANTMLLAQDVAPLETNELVKETDNIPNIENNQNKPLEEALNKNPSKGGSVSNTGCTATLFN